MAFTTGDLAALDRAISSGELKIEHNGRKVEYRSISDLIAARDKVAAELQSGTATTKLYPRHQLASFSDE